MQLSRDELLEVYRRMRTIRTFEEDIKIQFEKGNIPGFVHLYVGQEAGSNTNAACMMIVMKLGRQLASSASDRG